MLKTYAGGVTRELGACVVVWKDGVQHALPIRLDLWSHSPTGFEWGYGGSGPAQLALAILADATGSDTIALALHMAFKSEVVSLLSRGKGWQIDELTVHRWVLKKYESQLGGPLEFSLPGKTKEVADDWF